MENPNLIFFGPDGLTSTSANHVANLAKEYVQNIETILNCVQLYNSSVTLIGSSEKNVLSEGFNNEQLQAIPKLLESVYNANSLIAWLREAIKAKEACIRQIDGMTLQEYAEKFNIELPEEPMRRPSLTSDDVLATRTVKERNCIFSLQTKAAVIGKYIHLTGPLSKARKDFQRKQTNKNEVSGNGRDTLLYSYEPSCSQEVVEDIFFTLQSEHRAAQAELNGYMHTIDEEVKADEIKAASEYSTAHNVYTLKMQDIMAEFDLYKKNETRKIANSFKIIIPNSLKGIYEAVNALGK